MAPARHTPSACARSLSTSKLSIHVRHTLNTAIAQYSLASAKRSAYVASAHAPRAGSAHAGSAHAQHTIKQHTPRAHTRQHTRSAQAPHKLKRSAHARRHTLARTRSASSQQLTTCIWLALSTGFAHLLSIGLHRLGTRSQYRLVALTARAQHKLGTCAAPAWLAYARGTRSAHPPRARIHNIIFRSVLSVNSERERRMRCMYLLNVRRPLQLRRVSRSRPRSQPTCRCPDRA